MRGCLPDERTREMGVRMALGAQRAQLVWLFAKQTAAYAAMARPWAWEVRSPPGE